MIKQKEILAAGLVWEIRRGENGNADERDNGG